MGFLRIEFDCPIRVRFSLGPDLVSLADGKGQNGVFPHRLFFGSITSNQIATGHRDHSFNHNNMSVLENIWDLLGVLFGGLFNV